MQEENELAVVEGPLFREHEVGVIRVKYPEPANITLRERFTSVHPDFGNRVFSRGHVYDEWPEQVPMFYLECTRETSTLEVKKKLRELKSGAAAYEEMLGYYDWWNEQRPLEGWMALTVALDSGMLSPKHGLLVPAMHFSGNFFNFPNLGLCPENGPWPPKTRFLAIRGRGYGS